MNSTPSPSDPRIERTRAAVLEAGVSMLFDSGPDSITHAAIASAAKVSRTTLYKYWPTRSDLLLAILNQVEPHKSVEPTGDVRRDLLAMAFEMADAFADPQLNKMFCSLMAQAQWDDEASTAREALIDAGMTDAEQIFDMAVRNGQLPAGLDVERAAGQLIGPMFFAALITRRPMTHAEVEQSVDDWLAAVRA